MVVFLRAANNNRSSTVLDAFLGAVVHYGPPSRVRTDRGGENNAICLMMNIFRGFHRGSALRGRSTHNQRIERLWGDLWRGHTNVYYDYFHFLENEGVLDPDNEMHIWALHYVYLPRINRDLQDFMTQWNHHGLRTEHHMTPLQIFVRGCLQQQGRQSTAMQDLFAPTAGGPRSTDTVPVVDHAGTRGESASISRANQQLLDWPERVTVPSVDYLVPEDLMEQILAQFDPLDGPREEYGFHVFSGLVSFLESAAHHT